ASALWQKGRARAMSSRPLWARSDHSLTEPDEADLLAVAESEEDGSTQRTGTGAAAPSCAGVSEETVALLRQVNQLERRSAEQDSALAELASAVRRLRERSAEAEEKEAECRATCEPCSR
ncbi:unnamed protein product, partial [Prorocentrum cordatum]